MRERPVIIQGGMGVAVSSWPLANAVARQGQLGVVSGTALDIVLARRLQDGDPGGHLHRAIAHYPDREVAARVLARYERSAERAGEPYATVPLFNVAPTRQNELAALGGFVEVFLAREGHDGLVGINFLEKIQLPTPATLYGALLAGVDYVLVGAGIPRDIPALIEGLCRHEVVNLPLHVTGATSKDLVLRFDPRDVVREPPPPLERPQFLAIVASATLAASLVRHGSKGVDGFVVEAPVAGGHNAPPRGALRLNEEGEPIYGPRDVVDLGSLRALGLPFWLAGSWASPGRVRDALAEGAAGVQVGTAFALCDESGMDPGLRTRVLAAATAGTAHVFTDPAASPTGFPFKVVPLEGTLSDAAVYAARSRRCDLGYLRELYELEDGGIGYRCPAEPVADYVRKGGRVEDTEGRKCICNGLLATVGLGQRRADGTEPPIVTAGNDIGDIGRLLDGRGSYTAADVIDHLLDPVLTSAGSRPRAEGTEGPVLTSAGSRPRAEGTEGGHRG